MALIELERDGETHKMKKSVSSHSTASDLSWSIYTVSRRRETSEKKVYNFVLPDKMDRLSTLAVAWRYLQLIHRTAVS